VSRLLGRKTYRRWFYRGERPHRAASLLNRLQAMVASAGLPPHRVKTLVVRGRRTGRLISFPVVVADYGGERYLVAMLGMGANWVANVRAADGKAVLRHGHREAIRLEEVEQDMRAAILKRYLELAPGARAHFPVDPGAPLSEFEQIASRYPVFRIDADSQAGHNNLVRTE
jgi:hypothetical protein